MRVLYAKAVYGPDEIKAVLESLKNEFLSVGPNSEEFEKKVAKKTVKKATTRPKKTK